jgi:2',3'-cyclic-nucleotide 2'-phosphodiesterase (5'-nucleotidase family)
MFWGAGLMACSSANITVSSETNYVSNDDSAIANKIDSLIDPYSDSVKNEMSEIIALAEVDFTVQKKPSGNLNNWVADAVFVNQTRTVRFSDPVFCLLNTGGIRSSINKGDVTIGDIYKVMPFDNAVVWVRLPISVLKEIHEYIIKKGGDPLSNAVVTESNVKVNGQIERHTHVWVITSDYLMNGGDNMTFFEKRVETNNTGKLLRDVLLEEAKSQGTLVSDTVNRMLF